MSSPQRPDQYDTRKVTIERLDELKSEGLTWEQIAEKLRGEGLNVTNQRLRQKYYPYKAKQREQESLKKHGLPTHLQPQPATPSVEAPKPEPEAKDKTFKTTPKPSPKPAVPTRPSEPRTAETAKNPDCPYCEEELSNVKGNPNLMYCMSCKKAFKRD